jgi:CBS domain-containing protein
MTGQGAERISAIETLPGRHTVDRSVGYASTRAAGTAVLAHLGEVNYGGGSASFPDGECGAWGYGRPEAINKEVPMSPSGTILEPLRHTFLAPAFPNATVVDAMRVGVVSCPPDASLREVARIMATYRIHSVVVLEHGDERPWGIVSDSDIAAAAGEDVDARRARDVAHTELVTVPADETLARAAQLMAEHKCGHLVVVQPKSGHPVGVLSTLDLAGVLAWGGTS